MSIQRSLEDLGLSAFESKVYLDLIHVGLGSAQELSRRLSAPRSSVYTALEALIRRKLVTTNSTRRALRYRAESPTALSAAVEEQRELLDQKEKVIAKITRELHPLLAERVHSESRMEFVEGRLKVERFLFDNLELPYRRLGWHSDVLDIAEAVVHERVSQFAGFKQKVEVSREVAALGGDLSHRCREAAAASFTRLIEEPLQFAIDAVVRAFETCDACAIAIASSAVVARSRLCMGIHRASSLALLRGVLADFIRHEEPHSVSMKCCSSRVSPPDRARAGCVATSRRRRAQDPMFEDD